MADLLPAFPHLLVGRQVFEPMPDPIDEQWRQHAYGHFVATQWPSDQPSIDAQHMQAGLGLDLLQQNAAASYSPSYNTWAQQSPIVSRSMAFDAAAWASDIDMDSASPAAFATDPSDTLSHPLQHTASMHLQAPGSGRAPSSIHSPQSSHSGLSPAQPPPPLGASAPASTKRPVLGRSITVPAPAPRRSMLLQVGPGAALPTLTSTVKNESISGDDDDEFPPAIEEVKARGRKRTRIPHTAVERRYRENLNAHLEKLRQTVPTLASRRPGPASSDPSGGGVADRVPGLEAAKPSKCEILNGAIEHIGDLSRRNAAVEHDNRVLQARISELERYVSNLHR